MSGTVEAAPPAGAAAPSPEPDDCKPLRIEDYAMVGDCRTGALVGCNGSIDWLCWPRFDSGACFAALLGTARHGRWLLAPDAATVRATRAYQGDTMVLQTVFDTAEGSVAVTDFMPVGRGDSSVVRRVEGRRGQVAMRSHLVLRFDHGAATPWLNQLPDGGVSAVVGPNAAAFRTSAPVKLHDRSILSTFTVGEGETVEFTLTWGPSNGPLPQPFDAGQALAETVGFWQGWADACKYHGEWRPQVLRSLLTLKALTFEPTGGIVAALTTSLPEQLGGPRNWDYRYCWLRDATLTLHALMAGGYDGEAKAWIEWLHRAIAGSPDELQIMYGVDGDRRLTEWAPKWLPGYQDAAPVRVGNAASDQLQLDVYGEIMSTLNLARSHRFDLPEIAWALQSLFVEHLILIWEQPDEGLWEVRGGRRQFTFSKMMAWVALDRSVRDAERAGLDAPLDRWREVRNRMHADICEKGFDKERNTFTQCYGRPELDASLLRIPQVGFLSADDERVRGTVDAIERDLLVDGFVLRYRTENGNDGLTGGEGAFLPCSFWLVDAYTLLGRHDEAHALFGRLLGLANDVGLLSEEFDPKAGRLVGNFPQAFSHLALIGSALTIDGRGLAQEEEKKKGAAG